MTTILANKSDARAKTDLLNDLKWDPTLSETEAGVQVNNGVVTLTGAVRPWSERNATRPIRINPRRKEQR